ncbi:MAG: RIP metalloprotease RseP [Bacteroidales bacterium]|nr:RIP metalloprotease RseP [Bacteroidales bacterium]
MIVLIKTAQLLLSLSILVILHELGHFTFAKLFKTRVEKFYLFFNPWFSLFKFQKGETEYGVGWLPLGGYVKIAGMIDESMDREQLKKPPQPWEFRSKPAWQRLLIMLGGILVNFLLAFVIYIAVMFVWGDTYLPNENVKYGILVDSLGQQMGLQNGDKIIAIDSQKVEGFTQIVPTIVLDHSKKLLVERNGKMINVVIPDSVFPKLIRAKSLVIQPRLPFNPFIIQGFTKDSPGKEAGLRKNDRIVAVDSFRFQYYDQFRNYLLEHKGKQVTLTVERGSQQWKVPVKLTPEGMIGVSTDFSKVFEYKKVKYSFWASIPAGIHKGIRTTRDYLKQIRLIFSPKMKAYESLGGFITIGKIFPSVWDWNAFWNLTAFLSIILAIMNLLPIPGLDGGHVLFLLYEMITGRKPGDKFLEYAQILGMILLLALLVYANGNDIIKLFHK